MPGLLGEMEFLWVETSDSKTGMKPRFLIYGGTEGLPMDRENEGWGMNESEQLGENKIIIIIELQQSTESWWGGKQFSGLHVAFHQS